MRQDALAADLEGLAEEDDSDYDPEKAPQSEEREEINYDEDENIREADLEGLITSPDATVEVDVTSEVEVEVEKEKTVEAVASEDEADAEDILRK